MLELLAFYLLLVSPLLATEWELIVVRLKFFFFFFLLES